MKKQDTAKFNQILGERIIACLEKEHVGPLILSPGSRSTPLVMATSKSSHRHIVHFDERGAAYLGLGLAKQSKKPSILICTSGTALANYFPALIEAQESRVPLLVLSADRPSRLQGRGANQTIVQTGIYSEKVNLYLDLGETTEALEKCEALISKGVRASLSPLPGPVHINCPFEEPLYPYE